MKLGRNPGQKSIYLTLGSVQEYDILNARMSPDGSVANQSRRLLSVEASLPRSSIVPGTDNYCVQAVDGTAGVLDEQCFDLSFTTVEDFEPRDSYISANMNHSTAVASFQIRHGSLVIGALTGSANPPVISEYSLSNGSNSSKLCWTAADDDQDTMKYQIEYRVDAGSQWQILEVDWSDSCYTLDHGNLPSSSGGALRLSAWDGYHQSNPVILPININNTSGPKYF